MILEPGVIYPLMAVTSTRNYLDRIDKILTTFECSSLGLNEHFPRAVQYGPMAPRGMALPNTISKTTASQLTYFFYHTRLNTNIGKKLDASITFLQIKFGAFQKFLSLPFCQYGPLGTNTINKTILGDTEPNNLQLHTSPETA